MPRIVRQGLPPVLRIDSTVRDLVDVVVFPEEKLSRIVRQGDPLPGYLCGFFIFTFPKKEGTLKWTVVGLGTGLVRNSWDTVFLTACKFDVFSFVCVFSSRDLRPCELVGVHAEEIMHVAGGALLEKLLHLKRKT